MIEAIVRQLQQCRDKRDLWPIKIAAEPRLTPCEVAALVAEKDVPRFVAKNWFAGLSAMAGLPKETPEPYARTSPHPNVLVFSNPAVPTATKRLIVGFAGATGRMGLPSAVVLRFLPSDQCDLVLVSDPSRAHYLNGVPGYAGSTAELAAALTRDICPSSYRATYCCGSSMGGFAALRCAMLLRAVRGVSVGGRFPWHVRRLTVKDEPEVPAFDSLCHCNKNPPSELACVFGGHDRDRAHAERLSAILAVKQMVYPEIAGHNLFKTWLEQGVLRPFFQRIFDIEPEPRPVARRWWQFA